MDKPELKYIPLILQDHIDITQCAIDRMKSGETAPDPDLMEVYQEQLKIMKEEQKMIRKYFKAWVIK